MPCLANQWDELIYIDEENTSSQFATSKQLYTSFKNSDESETRFLRINSEDEEEENDSMMDEKIEFDKTKMMTVKRVLNEDLDTGDANTKKTSGSSSSSSTTSGNFSNGSSYTTNEVNSNI